MADQMKLALRGALLSAAADGVTDGAVEFVDAVVDTFRAENERLLEEAFDMGVDMTAMRDEIKRLREALEDARRFVDSSDCSCVIDTMNIAEHTPDCPVQAMAVRLDDALEATDDS